MGVMAGFFSTLKTGFRSISFEKISVLDSNFIHGYIYNHKMYAKFDLG